MVVKTIDRIVAESQIRVEEDIARAIDRFCEITDKLYVALVTLNILLVAFAIAMFIADVINHRG